MLALFGLTRPAIAIDTHETSTSTEHTLTLLETADLTHMEHTFGILQARTDVLGSYEASLGWIGMHATSATSYAGLDEYQSSHALALSSYIPQAASFARYLPAFQRASAQRARYPELERYQREGLPYAQSVAPGSVPIMYQWDERWGYTPYCGEPLGFTGCGVTVASMATLSLTGNTAWTPAAAARLATALGETDQGTNTTFFTSPGFTSNTGVEGTLLDDGQDAFIDALNNHELVALSVKPATLARGAHWVLAVGVNPDGTVNIHDPNSVANTTRTWDPAELMSYETSQVALRRAS